MQRYKIYFILMLFNWLGLSICQDINHRPIADRIIHHVTKNQNFMQQLKYFEDFQFDFSQINPNCIQYPKPRCLTELFSISQGPNVGKCKRKIIL